MTHVRRLESLPKECELLSLSERLEEHRVQATLGELGRHLILAVFGFSLVDAGAHHVPDRGHEEPHQRLAGVPHFVEGRELLAAGVRGKNRELDDEACYRTMRL